MIDSGRLLLDCLHQDASRLDAAGLARLGDHEWDELLALVERQRLRPHVQRRLAESGVREHVPARVRDGLRTACAAIARRNLGLHAELRDLIARFDEAGVPIAVLKGLHLATAIYGDVARREISDMDLLVPREHLARAVTLAGEAGYAPVEPLDIEADVATHQHIGGLVNRSNVLLELHWTLLPPHFPQTIDPDELWREAKPIEVFGRRAFALSAEHLLLHLCLHMMYADKCESGLRPLCDLSELIRIQSNALHWDRLRRQADDWKTTRSVSLALRLARDAIGARIPATAAAAFEFDALPADVVEAALGVAIVAGDPAAVPGRGIGGLQGRAPLGHLAAVFGTPADELRRMYPSFPRSRWIWWAVYGLRARDLLRRHAGTLARLFIVRDAGLRSTLDHQRRLDQFLASGR